MFASARARLRTADVLAMTAALWFLAKFLRYALPPLFGTFRSAYGASNTELGVVFSALMAGYAAMQFPSGALADRVGAVRVVAGGAAVASLSALALFASTSYAALVVAVVGIGVGTGAHKTVAITLLSRVYPDRTGRALGVTDTVGELGGVVAPAVVVATLAAALRWQVLFLVAALAGFAVAAAFRTRVPTRLPDDASDDSRTKNAGRAYLDAFAAPRFVAFVLVAVCFSFVVNGVAAFLPLFLESRPDVSAARAGLLYSGFFLVAVVQSVTGDLADRLGRLRVAAALLSLGSVALGGLLVAGSLVAVAAATLVLGVGLHGARPVRDAHLVARIPAGVAGGTLGVVRTSMMAAGAAAPAVVGYLSDVASFDVAFGVLAGALAVSVAVVVALAVAE